MPTPHRMPKAISFLRAICLMWALLVCPLALCLLCVCSTFSGVLFALASLFIGLAPLLWAAGYGGEYPRLHQGALAAFALWLTLTAWLVFRQPDGHSQEGSRVSNRYVGGEWHYKTQALGALLPEIDQFRLGYKLVPLVDALMTFKQSSALSAMTGEIYKEVEADKDFHALGSVMPDAYSDLWGRIFDHGHYFLYVPPALSKLPSSSSYFICSLSHFTVSVST